MGRRQAKDEGSWRGYGKAVAIGLVLSSCPVRWAHAAESAYGIGYISEYSDNITLAQSGGPSAWVNSAVAGLAYRESTTNLLANLQAQAEYRWYNHVYNDGPLYFLNGSAIWAISPQQLTWTVSDRYDYGILNPTVAYTPNNRTSYNAFETGPDYYAHVNETNTLTVGAKYGNVHYSDVDLSNQRYSGDVRWLYQTTAATVWSLNYEALKVKYDDDVLNVDFTRHDAFARVDTRDVYSHFTLDGGYTTIDRARGNTVQGPLARLSWTDRIKSDTTIGVFLSDTLEDAGTVELSSVTNPALAPGTPTATPVTQVVSGDVFRARSGELSYRRLGTDWSLDLDAFGRDFRFEQAVTLDRREYGGLFRVALSPLATTSPYMFGSQTNAHYTNIEEDDVDRQLGIGVIRHTTENLSITLEGRRTWRSSTVPTLGYTENSLWLTVLYSSGPLFKLAPRR